MDKFETLVLRALVDSIVECEDNTAFHISDVDYSYKQLGERISAIRRMICQLPSDEKLVGLALHDDMETYASVFALWMEGKAYVPLHPLHPAERNAEIAKQVGMSTILDSNVESAYTGCRVISTSQALYDGNFLDQWVDASADDFAYIIFTSGSTGIPKGVCITRNNVGAFMEAFWNTGISVSRDDRCLQCFDMTFDVSVQSYLIALTRGASLYTVPYGVVKYLYVASLIQLQKITVCSLAPSMLSYLRPYFDEFDANSLKTCILTAEACPMDLMESWSNCAINANLYDFYGPTEATIYCTYYQFDRKGEKHSYNGMVSIGKPLMGMKAMILDEKGRAVEDMQKGELCVSGPQLSSGYWNDDAKTKAAFFEKEIEGKKLRFYHTGDLCYQDVSGNIMYSGRIDQQAKIQGYRVELSEIEHYARLFYGETSRAVAIAYENDSSLTEIALFVESEEKDAKALLSYLRSKMPSYMIPSRVLFVSVFPLNRSDKVDRNELKKRLL